MSCMMDVIVYDASDVISVCVIHSFISTLRASFSHLRDSIVSNLRSLYDLSSPQPQLKLKLIQSLILMYGHDNLEIS